MAVTATLIADSDYDVGSPDTATVTINEEPIVTVVATTPTTVEDGSAPGVFTITRSGPTIAAVDVAFTLGGSAVVGTDYTSVGGSVTIPVGQSSATVNIAPLDDLSDDGNPSETVVLTLSSAAAYDIGTPASDTVTIDEEPPPTVTIAATTPTTVEDGGTPGAFTVNRTGPTDGALSVSYSLAGSAVNGTDYSTLSGTVTIPDGQASATFNVSPLDDLTDDAQASESVVATLSASASYLVGTPNQATVTIDEEPPPTVTIAATTDATAELSSSPGVFTVTRTGPTDGALAVLYQMSGTAVNGSDYSNLTGSVTIPDGQASATFDVSPLDDGDGDASGSSEMATATLSASSAYTVGAANQANVTIYEEPTVTIAASTPTTVEDGGAAGIFTVSRTGLTTAELTVSFTLGGTAISGTDYTNPGGSVTIAAGQSSATISIAPLDDADGDDSLASESVVATLSAASSYNVGAPNQATVTIDEESPPTVTIAATTPTTLETSGTPGVFTVTRTGPADDALTVNFSTSGSASAGTDYTALGGSVTIPVGQSSATIDVSPLDDGDGDDTTASASVTATLGAGTGYTIGSANSATVTIDEDILPTVTIVATTPTAAEVGGSGTFAQSPNRPMR